MQKKVQCNKCKQEFNVKIVIGDKGSDGRYEVFFICPHCLEKYFMYYENDESLEIKTAIKQLLYSVDNLKTRKGEILDKINAKKGSGRIAKS